MLLVASEFGFARDCCAATTAGGPRAKIPQLDRRAAISFEPLQRRSGRIGSLRRLRRKVRSDRPFAARRATAVCPRACTGLPASADL